MQRFVKQSLVVTATTWFLSALVLLVAQGRIFPHALAASPFAKLMGDSSFILSLPGVMVAVAIWGYNSSRTALSDVLIVAVNGTLYAMPIIVLLAVVRHWRESGGVRKPSA